MMIMKMMMRRRGEEGSSRRRRRNTIILILNTTTFKGMIIVRAGFSLQLWRAGGPGAVVLVEVPMHVAF